MGSSHLCLRPQKKNVIVRTVANSVGSHHLFITQEEADIQEGKWWSKKVNEEEIKRRVDVCWPFILEADMGGPNARVAKKEVNLDSGQKLQSMQLPCGMCLTKRWSRRTCISFPPVTRELRCRMFGHSQRRRCRFLPTHYFLQRRPLQKERLWKQNHCVHATL